MRHQAKLLGAVENIDRHLRIAAELARQRPFGPDAVAQNAAEYLRPRRRAGDLLDLRLAVDRKQRHPERMRARDIALLLDGVAKRDALGRGASRKHHLDLATEAVSKQEPSCASSDSTSGAGFAFTA